MNDQENEFFSMRWGVPVLDKGNTQIPNLFVQTYSKIGVTRQQFLFIIHLTCYKFESAKGECRPSLQTIAKEMGYKDTRTIQRMCRSLEEKKYLKIHQRKGRTSIYDFSGLSKALLNYKPGQQQPEEAVQRNTGVPLSPSTPPPMSKNTPEEEYTRTKDKKEETFSEETDPNSQFPTDSPLSSLGDPSLPKVEQRKITSYTDPGSMAAEVYRRTDGKQSWTEVSQKERQSHNGYAGDPVDAFREYRRMTGEVPADIRTMWGGWLKAIGKKWESTPTELAKAIRGIRTSEEKWRSYTVPKGDSFSGLIGEMIDIVRHGPYRETPNLDTFNFSGANQGRR